MATVVVGVAGKIASGKDTACAYFASRGVAVVDVDALGHEALAAEAERIAARFGAAVVPGGQVDRGALGRLVFADPAALAALEAIVHPAMAARARALLAAAAGPACCNAALLFRMGLDAACDRTLFIDAPDDVLVARAAARDGGDQARARAVLASQIDLNRARENADMVIENASTREEFVSRLAAAFEALFGRTTDGEAPH